MTKPQDKRVHCAVLAMDMVSYSREFDEVQARLVATLGRAIHSALSAYDDVDSIVLPTGDGAFIVFVGETSVIALDCVLQIHRILSEGLHAIPLRAGINEGPLLITVDSDGRRGVVGTTINIAQRVMDVGDANHIMISEVAHATLISTDSAQAGLAPLMTDPIEVKHGVRLRLYQYRDGRVGVWDRPSRLRQDAGIRSSSVGRTVDWPNLIQTSHSLKMIDLSMPLFGVPGLLDGLEDLLRREVTIKVLLLNPVSATMEVRRSSTAYDTPVELATTLEYVAKILLGFRSRIEHRCGTAASRRFDVRLFDGIPSMSAFIGDEQAYVSFYVEHLSGSRGPFLTVAANTPLYNCVSDAFDVLWNERALSIYDPTLAEQLKAQYEARRRAVEALEVPKYLG